MSRTTQMFSMLALAFSSAGLALAQAPAPAPAATTAAPASQQGVLKPGDRACLRQTGSLIPAKPGQCLPVAGRSYSHDDLQRTGAPDTARALQMLDPSVRSGR